MTEFAFSEFVPRVYPSLLHNLDLIKSWNDYTGIEHKFNKDNIQVNTQLLTPLTDVVPTAFSFKTHKIGNFTLSQISDNRIEIDKSPEILLYESNYKIRITLLHEMVPLTHVLQYPDLLLGNPDKTFHKHLTSDPDSVCYISPLSKNTLDELRWLSENMKSNRNIYFKRLVTRGKNQRFSSKNILSKLYDQYDFINIFQQSLMELDHPDLMVFYPKISKQSDSNNSIGIKWFLFDVNQSIKIHLRYSRGPYGDVTIDEKFVWGWRINVEIQV